MADGRKNGSREVSRWLPEGAAASAARSRIVWQCWALRERFAAGTGIYCASKWGLMGLSGCMMEDLREHGIRVSVVCPGSVATEFAGSGPKNPAKALSPDDVAHAVQAIVTQRPGSVLSEIQLRTLRKA